MRPFLLIATLVTAALPLAILRAYFPELGNAAGLGILLSAILVGALTDLINTTTTINEE